jgi:hypothetical protein
MKLLGSNTRKDVAYIVNTCPKYFYILRTHFGLLKRYAKDLEWLTVIATQEPENTNITEVQKEFRLTVISLDTSESDFWKSRLEASRKLPNTIKYVLPCQEGFLLERPGIDWSALDDAFAILDKDVNCKSVRLMPYPDPNDFERYYGPFVKLHNDDTLFTLEATLWRRTAYEQLLETFICSPNTKDDYQKVITSLFPIPAFHLAYPLYGSFANAVYLSPFPYRPSAIINGMLQPWAIELAERENYPL